MHHSLVYFTVFTQAAAGALLFREIFLRSAASGTDLSKFRIVSLMSILSILVIALILAFFHLGNPVNSVNALRNLATSWLSREILFLSLLMFLLVLYLIAELSGRYKQATNIISLLSVVVSFALVYSMIRLYTIPTVTSWYTPLTPVSFILTSLVCGLSFAKTADYRNEVANGTRASVLLAVFIAADIITTLLKYRALNYSLTMLFIIRIVLLLLVLIPLLSKKLNPEANKKGNWWFIILITLTLSEIISRYIFFLSFEKSGL